MPISITSDQQTLKPTERYTPVEILRFCGHSSKVPQSGENANKLGKLATNSNPMQLFFSIIIENGVLRFVTLCALKSNFISVMFYKSVC